MYIVLTKIGILGGTFNPPHNGHLYLAKKIKAEFLLDKVILLPNGQPPHKKGLASAKDRAEMIKLLIDGEKGIELSDIELKRRGTVYTVDTLTELSKVYDKKELFYLIGSDTLFVVDTWKNFDEVAKLTQFICLNRPGSEEGIKNRAEFLNEKFDAEIFLSEYSGPDVSSTQIREYAKTENTEVLKGLMPENLIRYILENKIYV